jgi:hypothetical protein
MRSEKQKLIDSGRVKYDRSTGTWTKRMATVETVKSVRVVVPVDIQDFGIADKYGAEGDDKSRAIDSLVRLRAMRAVWRKLEMFPQIEKIGGFIIENKQWGLLDHVKTFGATTKQYGPETREEWITLAAAVLDYYRIKKDISKL